MIKVIEQKNKVIEGRIHPSDSEPIIRLMKTNRGWSVQSCSTLHVDIEKAKKQLIVYNEVFAALEKE